MSKELRYRSIKEMLSLLDSSKKIYKNYLSDGHKFLYAKDLRSINEKIVNLINTQKFEKDEVLKPAFQNLKKHLEESGIDGPLPRNALKSVYAKLNSLILQKQTGAN